MAYVTDEELQKQLELLADELGISVQEALDLVGSRFDAVEGRVTTTETDIVKLQSDIQKITEVGELDSESIAEKIIAINKTIGETEDDVVKSLFDRIAENAKAVEAMEATIDAVDAKVEADRSSLVTFKSDLKDAQDAQDAAIEAVGSKVDANKSAQADINTGFTGRLDKNEAALDVLNGDANTDGSVAKAIAEEQNRTVTAANKLKDDLTTDIATAKTEAIAGAKDYADEEIGKVADKINILNEDATVTGSVAQKVKSAKDELTDSFTTVLKDAKKVLDDKDADLQAQIDALGDIDADSIKELQDQVTANKDNTAALSDIINDTTDEAGNLVKGAATKITDLEDKTESMKKASADAQAALQSQIDTLNEVSTGVVCGRQAANKFRLRLGQEEKDNSCDNGEPAQ